MYIHILPIRFVQKTAGVQLEQDDAESMLKPLNLWKEKRKGKGKGREGKGR